MDEITIIEKVKKYVNDKCKDDSTGHDIWHLQRVYKNAMLINEKENGNKFVITLIALMHDLYDHKFYEGDIEEAIKQTLKEINVYDCMNTEDINNVAYSCANLGFSANFKEKKELSKEGKIVQDADRLDAMGAMGIARTFAYGGKTGKPIYDENDNNLVKSQEEYNKNGSKTSISHFYDKLLKLDELLNTNTAKEIAKHRKEFMEEYLNEFFAEWNGKK